MSESYSRKRQQARQDHKEQIERREEDLSLQELINLVKKRFQTVFVGSVFKIEKAYGDLWGEHEDVDEEDMTDEQKAEYERFMQLREAIFDQGNAELNKMLSEIERFAVKKKKNVYKFSNKGNV
jgi:hypothetical protein